MCVRLKSLVLVVELVLVGDVLAGNVLVLILITGVLEAFLCLLTFSNLDHWSDGWSQMESKAIQWERLVILKC